MNEGPEYLHSNTWTSVCLIARSCHLARLTQKTIAQRWEQWDEDRSLGDLRVGVGRGRGVSG